MGVCINHRLGAEKQYVKGILDRAQAFAEKIKEEAKIFKISVKIERPTDTELYVDMDGCETLAFDFNPMSFYEKQAKTGWNYENETLKEMKSLGTDENEEHYKKYPGQVMYWASSFCKTQYAENIIEHKYIAEIVRMVAGFCKISAVNDEGDYYFSGVLEDATSAIEENGALINAIGKQLKGLGYEQDQIIKGGETKIKKAKK